jgi:hypothetical protein
MRAKKPSRCSVGPTTSPLSLRSARKNLWPLAARREKIAAAITMLNQQMDGRSIDIERLESLRKSLEYLQSRLPKPKGEGGRPGVWKGELGLAMVEIVEAMREAGSTIKDAVTALRRGTVSPWHKYSPEELQIRYQEARAHWGPWLKKCAEVDDEIDRALQIANRRAIVADDYSRELVRNADRPTKSRRAKS